MTTSPNNAQVTANLHELADYTKPGVTRKGLTKDEHTTFSLMCLTAGTQIPEHTASRNISVTVIEGQGILTLAGQDIELEPGVFVYLPAHTPHALQATENLAFLHT